MHNRASLKDVLKRAAVQASARWRNGNGRPRVVVLCYHSIHPAKWFATATPEVFDRQLRWLKDHCNVIGFSQAAGECRSAGRPCVAITFDDGYADNYEFAFPLLVKHGLTATFFVTAGLVEKHPEVVRRFQIIRETGYEDIRPMSWPQLREMAAAGMGIGAHTYSHPNLAVLSRAEVRRELDLSKRTIEDGIGYPVPTMAYPFGKPNRHFTSETQACVAEAGYSLAAAVLYRGVRSGDSRLAVPRICIGRRDDEQTVNDKIAGYWDVIGAWQEKTPLWMARLVSPRDFIAVPGGQINWNGQPAQPAV